MAKCKALTGSAVKGLMSAMSMFTKSTICEGLTFEDTLFISESACFSVLMY